MAGLGSDPPSPSLIGLQAFVFDIKARSVCDSTRSVGEASERGEGGIAADPVNTRL